MIVKVGHEIKLITDDFSGLVEQLAFESNDLSRG